MSKKSRKIIFLTAATLAGIYAYNKFVESTSTKNNLLKEEDGTYYEWKHGDIFYKKIGSGKPLLLIHDANTRASSEEWNKIYKKLAKNHTIYSIDLLGCGRSDKPALQYTNYLYVQLITDFIKDVIKESTDVVATNMSTSFVIMAKNISKDLFNKIILINPIEINKLEAVPTNILKLKQTIMQLPLIGTFLYNILNTPTKIDIIFKTKYFKHAQLVSSKLVSTYYESAHLGNSNGKYLYSSIMANYMNANVRNAIKKLDNNIYIIASRDLKNNINTIEKYHNINSNISITNISNGGLYPQLEIPEKIEKLLNNIL